MSKTIYEGVVSTDMVTEAAACFNEIYTYWIGDTDEQDMFAAYVGKRVRITVELLETECPLPL